VERIMAPVTGSRTARQTSRERWLRLVEDADEPKVPRSRSELLSRALNFTLALVALLLLAPLLVVIAVAVKVTSRGPIFYSQTRIGLDRRWARAVGEPVDRRRGHDLGGNVFTIYKFRTMCVNAEHLSGAVWAAREDPRVTPVGRFLRQYRLDELPQLFNVLTGDMNIVGPRPERPSIFAQLRRNIPHYEYRQRVKPGITGLAQVNQQYDQCLDDVRNKLHFDLQYLHRQGFWEDIRIMLKTVPVVLFKRGGW
jgi:lipopolysaccharide/colanic/teichoic acid biosynthesis glycosyltransferase